MAEKLIEQAKIAEQTERYEDMVKFMKEFTQGNGALTDEQRNLLSVAYKNVVGSRRSAWRIISSIEQKAADKQQETHLHVEYREKIEKELNDSCEEILKLIEDHLVPAADKTEKPEEAKVFYYKMKGDYLRYQVEVTQNEKRVDLMGKSNDAYNDASVIANVELPKTHPIRLGLALNYSVFHYEIMNKTQRACELAKDAFDEAIKELDDLKEESYKDSTLIMQLLRDNLTLWNSENDDADDAPAADAADE